MQDKPGRSYVGRLEERYLAIFPDFQFPTDLDTKTKLEALIASQGRKLVFTREGNSFQFFFEDDDTEPAKVENFVRLLGCGP